MQRTLTAGDSLNYEAPVPGYSPADGWQLRYRLAPRAVGGTPIDVAATASGSNHLVQVAPTTTATWAPGDYSWASWVERPGERYSVDSGQLTILPDPAQLGAGADTRSLPQRTLDELLAARAQWASTQGRVRRYKIGDREREFASAAELDAEIRFWQGQLAEEKAAARLASGLPSRNRILVRFTRPR